MINHPNRSKSKTSGDIKITRTIAKKVLNVVDAGLTSGVGEPRPGHMCVEAAVCYAMGLPHSDKPDCVAPALRSFKIRLNDAKWSSNEVRAKGLRRLALAQLGSAGFLDESEFIKRLCDLVLRKAVSGALKIAASIHPVEKHKAAMIAAAEKCEQNPSREVAREARGIAKAAADAAAAAAYAAAAADAAAAAAASERSALRARSFALARDKALADFAEGVVQILIEMKAPGCQWLVLTEQAA